MFIKKFITMDYVVEDNIREIMEDSFIFDFNDYLDYKDEKRYIYILYNDLKEPIGYALIEEKYIESISDEYCGKAVWIESFEILSDLRCNNIGSLFFHLLSNDIGDEDIFLLSTSNAYNFWSNMGFDIELDYSTDCTYLLRENKKEL